VEERAA
jgi:sulfite reductase alpha subunit-like flavoprotein